MKTQLILGAAVLALAACGGSGGDDSGSAGNGSAAAAGTAESRGSAASATGGGGSGGAVSLQHGEWEMKTEVVNVKVAGLPEGVADAMKQEGKTSRTCMTEEEAKAPTADMFNKDNAANCKSEDFSWSGGRIKGRTSCEGEGAAGKTVMTMDGGYTSQSIDMTMKTETEMMGKGMTLEMRLSGRRVGECTAATKEG